MAAIQVPEEVKPLAGSLIEEVEEVIRESEESLERPVLYFTAPLPWVRYYTFRPDRAAHR